MRRDWIYLLLFAALLVVVGFNTLPDVVARTRVATVRVTVRNEAPLARTVRVRNRADDVVVATFEMAPHSKTDVSFPERPFLSEPIDRYTRGAIVEVLGDGCEMIERATWDPENGDANRTIWIGLDPQARGRGPVAVAEVAPTPIHDPCGGADARPTAVIYNRRKVPIAVAPGVIVPACSTRLVRPGDLPAVGFDADPSVPEGAVRVDVWSIAIQDERWPMEMRRVLVTPGAVVEEDSEGWPAFEEIGACG